MTSFPPLGRSRYNNGSNRRRNEKLRVCFFRSLPQENIDQGYHTIRLKMGWEEKNGEREEEKRRRTLEHSLRSPSRRRRPRENELCQI